MSLVWPCIRQEVVGHPRSESLIKSNRCEGPRIRGKLVFPIHLSKATQGGFYKGMIF